LILIFRIIARVVHFQSTHSPGLVGYFRAVGELVRDGAVLQALHLSLAWHLSKRKSKRQRERQIHHTKRKLQ
jgi:hypothetical protein